MNARATWTAALLLALLPFSARAGQSEQGLARFIREQGPAYGLSYAQDGRLRLLKTDPKTGAAAYQALGPIPMRHLSEFASCITPGSEQQAAVAALRSYLRARSADERAFGAPLIESRGGAERLSALGRRVLIDILTAEDGVLFGETQDLKARLTRIKAGPRYGNLFKGLARRPQAEGELEETFDGASEAGGAVVDGGSEQGSLGTLTPAQRQANRATLLRLGSLRDSGMKGKGSITAVIDTGLDIQHPDFKGRVLKYLDLTGEGKSDYIGHGTHVAGVLAGDGAASGGRYMGAAPETQLLAIKVYRAQRPGEPTGDFVRDFDDRTLAAMEHIASLPEGQRPQVLNISITGSTEDPIRDHLNQMVNRLTVRDNILVVASAGNRSMDDKVHVELLGNAKYALSVTAANSHGRIASFASQGPVSPVGGYEYNKPDLATVGGGVNPGELDSGAPATFVTGPKSSAICGKNDCSGAVGGYTQMRGTSQAAPMASGAAADVIGYLRSNKVYYRATEVKALLMETARQISGETAERQGAGLLNGEALAETAQSRVRACTSIGNVAFMLSQRLTSPQREALSRQSRYKSTPLGLYDSKSGHLVNSDRELVEAVQALPGVHPVRPKPQKTFAY